MKTIQRFEAFDGEIFATADECRAHEDDHIEGRLVGLTLADVHAALSRENIETADAIEKIGSRIAALRVKSGDLRRRPKADLQDHQAPAGAP